MVSVKEVRPSLGVLVLFVMLCHLLRLHVCLPTGPGSLSSQCVECSTGSVCPEEAGLRMCGLPAGEGLPAPLPGSLVSAVEGKQALLLTSGRPIAACAVRAAGFLW